MASDEFKKPPAKAVVAGKTPIKVVLDRGVYFWCACGLSTKQPFCDGSHERPDLSGLRVVIKEDQKEVYFCTCKQTGTPPYCDGSHSKLP